MSGNAWQLAAFIGGLDPDDKAGVIAWLRDHELSSNRTNPGLTLSAYATAKRLPETFLRGLGLQDTRWRRKPAVFIPYQDAGGKLAASRFRLSLNGDSAERFRWQKGSKPLPYGLASLPEARKQGYVTLVEGESDAQTLWLHSIPALGIPRQQLAKWVGRTTLGCPRDLRRNRAGPRR